MSRLFGFVINDSQRVACALHPARAALVAAAAPEGWGLASYQGGEVLLQRHPKPVVGALDLYPAARDQRTDYMVGHVREAGTPAKLENTQPFRFRSWVFAASGPTPPTAAQRAALLEHVPDFLRRNIRGQTAAEELFHVFLSFLHDASKLDDPNIGVGDTGAALAATQALASQIFGTHIAANVIATNGRVLLAARAGRPMHVRQTNGIVDCAVCRAAAPDHAKSDRRRTHHEHVRSILIVSEASEPDTLPADAGFEEVPDGSILAVNRELAKTLLPK
jgi:glutamine amidotransferase